LSDSSNLPELLDNGAFASWREIDNHKVFVYAPSPEISQETIVKMAGLCAGGCCRAARICFPGDILRCVPAKEVRQVE
jgi:hypothetical protein